MSAAHTPGPWFANTAGHAIGGMPFAVTEIYVYAPNAQDDTAICADVIDPVTQEPSEANARLIAAAPELLEALTQALHYCDAMHRAQAHIDNAAVNYETFPTWRAIIAKATGATT